MGIARHGKFYRLDIWVRGKRIRRSLGTDEHYLALDRARDIAAQLREPPSAGLQIAEFFCKYRAWARETKPSSFRTEDYRLKWLEEWFKKQGITTLEEVTPWHIEQMRAAVRAHDRRAKDDGPFKNKESSKATLNRYAALMRTVFNKAREWGTFSGANPVSKVKFYRESPEVRPLSDADTSAVMKAAATIAVDPQSDVQRILPDLFTLALNTGLRRSELVAVRWRDIQGDDLAVRGKGNKHRIIPLNEIARDVIVRQPRDGEFVFAISNRHQPDLFRRTVKRVRELSGVEHFHMHLLRHRFATELIRAGADIITTSQLLGHSFAMTTLLYAHSSPDSKKRAVSLLGALGGSRSDERKSPPPDTRNEKKPEIARKVARIRAL